MHVADSQIPLLSGNSFARLGQQDASVASVLKDRYEQLKQIRLNTITTRNMDITWQGDGSITIKGKKTTVKINPKELKKDSEDVVIFSSEQADHKGLKIFDWPGEYEIKSVPIVNMRAWTKPKDDEKATDTLISRFEVDGISFCHLGDLGHEITSETTDKIGDVDILIVPVEGNLPIKKIQSIIEEVEPRAVLPVNYTSLAEFNKELSVEPIEAQKSYSLKTRGSLPDDKREYIILEKS